jgi:hypothetical protein
LKNKASDDPQTALVTLLERRHLEHTFIVLGVPLSTMRTFFTLGFQNLLVLLTEWLTLLPYTVSLLQISHFAIYITPPLSWSLKSHKALTILTQYRQVLQGFFEKWLFFAATLDLCRSAVLPATAACLIGGGKIRDIILEYYRRMRH